MKRASWHLGICGFLILAAGISLWITITRQSPATTQVWVFGLFYTLVFVEIYALGAFLTFLAGSLVFKNSKIEKFIRTARRQGVLLGFFTVISLMLLSANLFTAKISIPLLLIFLLLEIYTQ